MKPTLLVLAAGMGSRYGGVKQIDPVGPSGEAIIDYSIYDAIQAGFGRVVFVVRRDIEDDVRAFFAGKFDDTLPASYVIQDLSDIPEGYAVPEGRTKPWGTAQAVLAARDVIDAPFAVINGDDFYGRPALTAMAGYLSGQEMDETDYAMVGYRLDQTLSDNGTVSRGIVQENGEGWLVSIEEHTKIKRDGNNVLSLDDAGHVKARFTGTESTSMNLFGFTPAVMAQFRREFTAFLDDRGHEQKSEFYIPHGMNALNQRGDARMKVLHSDSPWFGVTYKEDRPDVIARIQQLVDTGDYPPALWG